MTLLRGTWRRMIWLGSVKFLAIIAKVSLFINMFTNPPISALLTDHKLLGYMRTRNYTVGLAEGFDGCAPAVFRLLGIKSYHETNAIPIPEATCFSHGLPYDFRHIPGNSTHWNYFYSQLFSFPQYTNWTPQVIFCEVAQFLRILGSTLPITARSIRASGNS